MAFLSVNVVVIPRMVAIEQSLVFKAYNTLL